MVDPRMPEPRLQEGGRIMAEADCAIGCCDIGGLPWHTHVVRGATQPDEDQ